jgi:hypothetical protein
MIVFFFLNSGELTMGQLYWFLLGIFILGHIECYE